MAISKTQATDLDEVLETLTLQQARVAERLVSARRSVERYTDDNARLIASISKVRAIRGA